MKSTLLLCIGLISAQFMAQSTNPSPYCTAVYSDDIFNIPHYLLRVRFGTLDNNSGTNQYMAPHYVFYNNLPIPEIQKGNSTNLIINHDDGATIHGIAAWIDYNQDHDFDDLGEKVGESLFPGDGGQNPDNSITYLVTIPANALSGNTRLRVRIYEDDEYTFSGQNLPVLPCQFNNTDYDWGETEDYVINISGQTSGIDEIESLFSFNIESGFLKIKSEDEIASIELLDPMGKKVAHTNNSRLISIDKLQSGIYFIKLTTFSGKEFSKKIAL